MILSYHLFKDGAYFCYCTYVHLEILVFPMGGVYQYMDFFAQFKTMWRKQNLACDLGIPKENWGGNHTFPETIQLQFRKKNAIRCFVFWRFLKISLVNYL